MKKSKIILLSALALFCCISFVCIYQGNNGDFEYIEIDNSSNSVTNTEKNALFLDYLKGQIKEHLLSIESVATCDILFEASNTSVLSTTVIITCESELDIETKLAITNYISTLLNLSPDSITIEYKKVC